MPLIDHALHRLVEAGLSRAVVTLGYGADAIAAHLAAGDWPLAVETVTVADWDAPNGVSLLAAASRLGGAGALLVMCDHLVDPALYALVRAAGVGAGLTLGVDRRLDHPWVDPDDVTRVRTAGDRIVAIGKGLAHYDAFDTGVFAIAPAFVAVLAALDRPAISDGVRALAARGAAGVVETGTLGWIDVDDAAARAQAQAWLEQRSPLSPPPPGRIMTTP